ncbi:MAG: hypothetical protein O3C40_13605 [Planctomycetota bacterium]|nr:hypothetical protein [Planctomycetota bacterium]
MKITNPARTSFQRGTITHEATMAIVLATAVIVGTAQTLAFISHQRRDIDRQSIAIREAGNLLEEIAARPWNDITKENLATLALSDDCNAVLREPRLSITVDSEPAGSGKHISVEIDWLTGPGQRALPLRVAAWRYPTGESDQ